MFICTDCKGVFLTDIEASVNLGIDTASLLMLEEQGFIKSYKISTDSQKFYSLQDIRILYGRLYNNAQFILLIPSSFACKMLGIDMHMLNRLEKKGYLVPACIIDGERYYTVIGISNYAANPNSRFKAGGYRFFRNTLVSLERQG